MDFNKDTEVIKGFGTIKEAQEIAKKLHCRHKKIVPHITFLGNINYLIEVGKNKYLLTKHKVFKK